MINLKNLFMSSSLVFRYGAKAQLLAKRFLSIVGRNNVNSCRNYSADAAAAATNTVQNRGNTNKGKDDVVQKKLKASFDKEISKGAVIPTFKRALLYGNKIAIRDESGEYSYNQIYIGSKKLAKQLSDICGNKIIMCFRNPVLLIMKSVLQAWNPVRK